MDECISEGDSRSPLYRMFGYDLYSSRLIIISPDAAAASCVEPPTPGIAGADCATNMAIFFFFLMRKRPAWSSLPPGPFLSAAFPCRGSSLTVGRSRRGCSYCRRSAEPCGAASGGKKGKLRSRRSSVRTCHRSPLNPNCSVSNSSKLFRSCWTGCTWSMLHFLLKSSLILLFVQEYWSHSWYYS